MSTGRVEPHGDRTLVQQLPCPRIDIGTAARCDHPHVAFDQPRDQPPFAVAEVLLSVALENLGRRVSGCVLDRRIAVHEGDAEPLREPPPDGRLADAHQADEHDRAVERC